MVPAAPVTATRLDAKKSPIRPERVLVFLAICQGPSKKASGTIA
jgi:hypothetical protein